MDDYVPRASWTFRRWDWLYDLEKGCFFLDDWGRFGFGRVDLLLFLGMMGAVRGGKAEDS